MGVYEIDCKLKEKLDNTYGNNWHLINTTRIKIILFSYLYYH